MIAMLVFLCLCILSLFVFSVYGDSCYKTIGSYVYSTYCSGYCSGTYGSESCSYSTYYTYYYYYYTDLTSALSTGAIVGIVIGCLIALAVVIAIIVVIIKCVSKSSNTTGTVVHQRPVGSTVTYSVTPATTGQPYGNEVNNSYLGQQNYPPTSGVYQPNNVYPPNSGYPPQSNQGMQPSYTGNNYGGMTPVDSKNSYI